MVCACGLRANAPGAIVQATQRFRAAGHEPTRGGPFQGSFTTVVFVVSTRRLRDGRLRRLIGWFEHALYP